MLRRLAPLLALSLLVAPATAKAEVKETVLSKLDRTVWAHADFRAPAYRYPRMTDAPVARLHLDTEDNLPEVYQVLKRRIDENRRTWFEIRIPRRYGANRAWVQATALGRLHTVTTRLVVNRRTLRATFYRRGRVVRRVPVGIGAGGTPTPRGKFWIREAFRVAGGGGGPYGPYAFGTSAYSALSDWPGGGVVGIHGTNQPGLVPGRPSHGCIRMRNSHIRWMARHLLVGTPLHVI